MGERDPRPVRFDASRLVTALDGIPAEAWSLASTYADTRVHHGYRRVVLVSAGHPQPHAELFGFVWAALHPIRDAWLSWIDPGGFIVPHRDPGPWRERWQVPISAEGQWLSRYRKDFFPEAGRAFRVEHWEPHAVLNRNANPRIHLVLDRDIEIGLAPKPFETYPIPADMADFIERSTGELPLHQRL